MDYQNVTLEEDPEYAYYKAKLNTETMALNAAMIVTAMLVVTMVVTIVKTIKYKKEENSSSENSSTSSSIQPTIQTDKFCEYCGSKLPENERKCPLCGATNN